MQETSNGSPPSTAFEHQIKLYTDAIVTGDDALLEEARQKSDQTRNALTSELAATNTAISNQQYLNLVLFCFIALSATLATALIVSRFIVGPIRQAVEMLKNIATGEGDLTKRLEINSTDEIGEMGKWFDQFIENVQEIIADIATKANDLNSSAVHYLTIGKGGCTRCSLSR